MYHFLELNALPVMAVLLMVITYVAVGDEAHEGADRRPRPQIEIRLAAKVSSCVTCNVPACAHVIHVCMSFMLQVC